jgi:hypothetical protein
MRLPLLHKFSLLRILAQGSAIRPNDWVPLGPSVNNTQVDPRTMCFPICPILSGQSGPSPAPFLHLKQHLGSLQLLFD